MPNKVCSFRFNSLGNFNIFSFSSIVSICLSGWNGKECSSAFNGSYFYVKQENGIFCFKIKVVGESVEMESLNHYERFITFQDQKFKIFSQQHLVKVQIVRKIAIEISFQELCNFKLPQFPFSNPHVWWHIS